MRCTLALLVFSLLPTSARADAPRFGSCDPDWNQCAISDSYSPEGDWFGIDTLVLDGHPLGVVGEFSDPLQKQIRVATGTHTLVIVNVDEHGNTLEPSFPVAEMIGEPDPGRAFGREFTWLPGVRAEHLAKKGRMHSCYENALGWWMRANFDTLEHTLTMTSETQKAVLRSQEVLKETSEILDPFCR